MLFSSLRYVRENLYFVLFWGKAFHKIKPFQVLLDLENEVNRTLKEKQSNNQYNVFYLCEPPPLLGGTGASRTTSISGKPAGFSVDTRMYWNCSKKSRSYFPLICPAAGTSAPEK